MRAKKEAPIFESGEGAADVRSVLDQMRARFGDEVFEEVRRQMQGMTNGGNGTATEFAGGEDALDGGESGVEFADNVEPVHYAVEHEHVIDFRGRLRRAWRFWQFRLFVLALAQGAGAMLLLNDVDVAGPVFGLLGLFLFGAWSVALFHKRGLGPMFLKWLIYVAVLAAGAAVGVNVEPDKRAAVVAVALSAALLLTLSKISDWMGAWIRENIWESAIVRKVRGWF